MNEGQVRKPKNERERKGKKQQWKIINKRIEKN